MVQNFFLKCEQKIWKVERKNWLCKLMKIAKIVFNFFSTLINRCYQQKTGLFMGLLTVFSTENANILPYILLK